MQAPQPVSLSKPLSRQRCCSKSGSGSGRSRATASMVSASSWASGTLAPAITIASGPPSASTSRLCFTPGLPRSVGLGPRSSSQAGLPQRPVRRLPLPVAPAQILARLLDRRPQCPEHPTLDPALEVPMHGAVVGILLGQPVPLAPRPQPEDHPIHHRPLVHPVRALRRRRVVLGQHRLDHGPLLIRQPPDRWQRRPLLLRPAHAAHLLPGAPQAHRAVLVAEADSPSLPRFARNAGTRPAPKS